MMYRVNRNDKNDALAQLVRTVELKARSHYSQRLLQPKCTVALPSPEWPAGSCVAVYLRHAKTLYTSSLDKDLLKRMLSALVAVE